MSDLPDGYKLFPRQSGAANWLFANQTYVNGSVGPGVAYFTGEDMFEVAEGFFLFLGLDDNLSTICVPPEPVIECVPEEPTNG